MTDFEKYLQQNKSQMNLDEINPKIWEGIEKQQFPKKKKIKYRFLKLASVAAIFLLGIVCYQFLFRGSSVEFSQELYAEYGFENQNIQETIDNKINEIRQTPIPVTYKNDLQLLHAQVKYLDKTYQSSVNYLQEKGYEESIAKEVLAYYKRKSELLDKLIFEMQKINNNAKEYKLKQEKSFISI